MDTKEIVLKLIFGESVTIIDNEQAKQVRTMLREIKNNSTIVLSQLNERLKNIKN
jgi:hypothetical protein